MSRGPFPKLQVDTILAVGFVGVILLFIIPLPPLMLDVLLSLSLVFSVMTLLLTLYVNEALEFSSFPSLLLFLTLFRLGLNISTTRMILTKGEGGDIINTFGNFMTQGSTAIGLMLFLLLSIINFIVVTKGSGRIAEVAARFTLEAVPGKQMAVDGDLAASLISQDEAKQARQKITEETDFYAAMDGASKFIRGDAIASLVIIAVNIFGGFFIGVFSRGYSPVECWNQFVCLTIGDGLVSQLPALFISVAAGILVARTSSGSLGKTMSRQILSQPKVLLLSGMTLLVIGCIPGMPLLIMLPMALMLGGASFVVSKAAKEKEEVKPFALKQRNFITTPIEIEVGLRLIAESGELQQMMPQIRERIGSHLGIQVPSITISDNLDLPSGGYVIKVKGNTEYTGQHTTLMDFGKQLTHVIEKNAYALINRQDIVGMIEQAKRVNAAVIEEVIPKKLSQGHLLKVVQHLLKEGVPICDFITILELIADHVHEVEVGDVQKLTELVRQGLSRKISERFFGTSHRAHAIMLDPKVEQMLDVAYQKGDQCNLRPKMVDKLAREVILLQSQAVKKGIKPVVVTSVNSRFKLRSVIEKHLPDLPVLSYSEIDGKIEIEKIGTVSTEVLI